MWLNPRFPAGLVTFTEEILNGKLRSLWSDILGKDGNMDSIVFTENISLNTCFVPSVIF